MSRFPKLYLYAFNSPVVVRFMRSGLRSLLHALDDRAFTVNSNYLSGTDLFACRSLARQTPLQQLTHRPHSSHPMNVTGTVCPFLTGTEPKTACLCVGRCGRHGEHVRRTANIPIAIHNALRKTVGLQCAGRIPHPASNEKLSLSASTLLMCFSYPETA